MNIRRYTLAIVIGFCLMTVLPSNVYANTLFLSWSGAFGAGTATVSVTNQGGGQFKINSFSGATQNGLSLTLLSPNSYGFNDNLIFPSGTPVLDDLGFAFTDGKHSYDIYKPFVIVPGVIPGAYYECSSGTGSNCIGFANLIASPLNNFNVSTTPEPSPWLLVATGLLGLMAITWTQRVARPC